MAEEKTEPPSQKRLRDAKKKGQVCLSRDVSSTLILIAAFSVFGLGWPRTLAHLRELIVFPARFYTLPFEAALPQVMAGVFKELAVLTLPMVGAVLVAALAGSYFQVGALLTFEPVMPKFEKINPLPKLKQMFGIKSLIELGKGVVKLVFLGTLIYLLVRDLIRPLMLVPYTGIDSVLEILGPAMKTLAWNVGMAYAVVAAADYFLQKKQYIKGLKMSKQEVKQEYKEMEGNPEIKSKRKQLHKEMMMNDTMQKTRKATVLVTNPTHYAVAIDYEQGRTRLPVIVAKGEGFLARKMVEIAREENIPIMQNVPLAHELFDNAPVDNYIPADLMAPVAEVLKWVRQLKTSNT
jgi:type III secretion protein U